MQNVSKVIKKQGASKNTSRLIKAMAGWTNTLSDYDIKPKGVFGSVATVRSGDIVFNSNELDIEFTVEFDDNLEANEAEITIYNLSTDTINRLKAKASISITAGYSTDTGVIFNGFIDRVKTKYNGADKMTVISCLDDVSKKTVESVSFAKGTKASYILKSLINKTGLPIAVFKMRRDHTYDSEQTVDGDLMENIKKFSEVCGVSTYVSGGKIYSRYIKEGDNINFTVEEDTGMIGSPEYFEEEQTAEDFTEKVKGYKIKMLLQHRMTAGAIINLSSIVAKGQYRVRKGSHTFSPDEATTEIEVI